MMQDSLDRDKQVMISLHDQVFEALQSGDSSFEFKNPFVELEPKIKWGWVLAQVFATVLLLMAGNFLMNDYPKSAVRMWLN